jgi:hypothetical protein
LTGLDVRCGRPSNGQQPEPIFNVNMMLLGSLLDTSDSIQAVVSANDMPSF